ncbi:MAG: hypothetical protein SVG88_06615 [Halobacteriales archaeon]|nr:hypothetical protein [Halobacteriales archaeon]
MPIIENLYLATSALLSLAAFLMVVMAIRAYLKTTKDAMIHLSLGFTLIVGATVSTAISGFLIDFSSPRMLLLVNNSFSTFGYLFVVYSLVTYK